MTHCIKWRQGRRVSLGRGGSEAAAALPVGCHTWTVAEVTMAQDREEFRTYLEEQGVVEALTKALLQMFQSSPSPGQRQDCAQILLSFLITPEEHHLTLELEQLRQNRELYLERIRSLDERKKALLAQLKRSGHPIDR